MSFKNLPTFTAQAITTTEDLSSLNLIENPATGDVRYVVSEREIYAYGDLGWEIASTDGIALSVATTADLTSLNAIPSPEEGDVRYVTSEQALYAYNGTAWVIVGDGGINAVVEDTSPQLGGDLDLLSRNIFTSVPGKGVVIAPNGGGAIQATSTGNARGAYATDWQRLRDVDTQVASNSYSVIAGGRRSTASGFGSSILGGNQNQASGQFSSIGGGAFNIASNLQSTVSGGASNISSTFNGTIGGGQFNTVSGDHATIAGGLGNTVSAFAATITGGINNTVTDSFGTVLGGRGNTAGFMVTATGGGASSTGAFNFVVGNENTDTPNPTNNHFVVDGVNSDVKIGRHVNQAFRAASSNRLSLHTVLANQQERAVRIRAHDALTATYDLQLPDSQGAARTTLQNDGSGNLSWASAEVVDDTSPQLGGDLDVQSFKITTGIVNGGLLLEPNGEGPIYSSSGGNARAIWSTDWQRERTADTQVASGTRSVIAGGRRNTASNLGSAVLGGSQNTSSGSYSTIGGGILNTASNQYTFIGGGSTNTASGLFASVLGGLSNVAAANYSTASGRQNNISSSGTNAVIAGGVLNSAVSDATSIGGGRENVASGTNSTVGGGYRNQTNGVNTVISGGSNNRVIANHGTVSGGESNTAHDLYSTVLGGRGNFATAYATVTGGGSSAVNFFDFVVGNQDTITPNSENNHFVVDGINSDVKIGRHVNQAFKAASSNRLSLHTVLANQQERAVRIRAHDALTATYDLQLPDSQGAASTVLQNDGSGNLSWAARGSLPATLGDELSVLKVRGGAAEWDIDFNDMTKERSGKVSGIFTIIEWKDGAVLRKRSTLSGGVSPLYTTRTVNYYDTDGTTILNTKVYTLSYDVDDDFESEVV